MTMMARAARCNIFPQCLLIAITHSGRCSRMQYGMLRTCVENQNPWTAWHIRPLHEIHCQRVCRLWVRRFRQGQLAGQCHLRNAMPHMIYIVCESVWCGCGGFRQGQLADQWHLRNDSFHYREQWISNVRWGRDPIFTAARLKCDSHLGPYVQ